MGRRILGYGFLTSCIIGIKASSCMLFGKRQTYLVDTRLHALRITLATVWRNSFLSA
jgi:hypothetical protein